MFNLTTRIGNRLNKLIHDRKHRAFIPHNYKSSDVFLVSFPRSGNTWLRFLLANALRLYCNVEREINFFTVREIIPDIHASRYVDDSGIFGYQHLPRIIKSHRPYNPYYGRVILLVRDPRDVITSYYSYLLNRNAISEKTTLYEYLCDPRMNAFDWVSHTESWCFTPLWHGQFVRIVLYENLLKDAHQELNGLLDLLGINLSSEKLSKAIALSSKDNMKASEEKHRSTVFKTIDKRPFVGKAKQTGGKEISDRDRLLIEEKTRKVAKFLGYFE